MRAAPQSATATRSPQKRRERKPNCLRTPSPLTRNVGSTLLLSGLVKKNGVGASWNSLICVAPTLSLPYHFLPDFNAEECSKFTPVPDDRP